jgi:hypothetical protein
MQQGKRRHGPWAVAPLPTPHPPPPPPTPHPHPTHTAQLSTRTSPFAPHGSVLRPAHAPASNAKHTHAYTQKSNTLPKGAMMSAQQPPHTPQPRHTAQQQTALRCRGSQQGGSFLHITSLPQATHQPTARSTHRHPRRRKCSSPGCRRDRVRHRRTTAHASPCTPTAAKHWARFTTSDNCTAGRLTD